MIFFSWFGFKAEELRLYDLFSAWKGDGDKCICVGVGIVGDIPEEREISANANILNKPIQWQIYSLSLIEMGLKKILKTLAFAI